MRILVVQESDWLEKGPHQSHHLMERLSLRGHQILVIDYEILWKQHSRVCAFSKRKILDGGRKATSEGEITVVRPWFVKLPILDYVSMAVSNLAEIHRQIKSFQPDVIVAFGIMNASIARKLASRYEIPFVYYIIDELFRLVPEERLRSVARYVESGNMAHSDIVISINEGLRDYTVSMGATPSRTRVIRAGVDLARYDSIDIAKVESLRTKLRLSRDDTVLFFMGWLYDFSGLREVVYELSKPKWRNKRLKLLILGKGDLWAEIQETRMKFDLEDVVFMVDWVPYSDVPMYVLASDVCILPASKNGIMMNIVPIKLYEYLAARKTVVSTDLPGIRSEFGQGNGVVYVDGPEMILDRVQELLEGSHLSDLGEQGRRFVENQSWDRVTDDFEAELSALTSIEGRNKKD
jgi:glycosyltransferase involved in cell wall biosynthesis